MTEDKKSERFTVKLFEDSASGGAKIYIRKDGYSKIKEKLKFPVKEELVAEIFEENGRLCIWIL